jgi:hypothetical protein
LALSLGIGAAILAFFMLSPPAHAQATRTWVSGVGDDLNPCSRTAPCKTFAGAISKTAAGGEINCIDPGGFGAVTITKSITIDCGATLGSILASGTNGVIVNAANVVVTLRNLSVNGAGSGLNGVRFLQGAALHVENLVIFGFTQRGIAFEPSSDAALFASDTSIRGNAGGILVKPATTSNSATIDNVRLERNTVGLRIEIRGRMTMSESIVAGGTTGVELVSGALPGELNLSNVVIAGNSGVGIQSSGAQATIRLAGSVVAGNGTGIASGSGAVLSLGDNLVAGNTTNGTPTGGLNPL